MCTCTYVGGHAQQLHLTSQPQTSGTYCPGPITFTCVGTQIGAGLFWEVNGSTVASYQFRVTDTFPQNLSVSINPTLNGVMAEVISASINPPGSSTIDITSMLSVRNVSALNGASLYCEIVQLQSNVIQIEVDKTQSKHKLFLLTDLSYSIVLIATPPSPSSISCSLLPSPGGAEVSLQWSPSFTSQYAVVRYRVSVNPDPSSCSSDQVSPSEDYSCSGLALGTLYTFTVSAINCGDQEGEINVFTISYNSKLCDIC